jgi:hypothetical protein
MKRNFTPHRNLIVLFLIVLGLTLQSTAQKELLGLTDEQKRVIIATSNRAEYWEKIAEIRQTGVDEVKVQLQSAIDQLENCRRAGELTVEIEASYMRQIEELTKALKESEKKLRRAVVRNKIKNWLIVGEAVVIGYFVLKG